MTREIRSPKTSMTAPVPDIMINLWRSLRREQVLPAWAIALLVLLVMLVWNWQLMTALGVGALVMATAYGLQDGYGSSLTYRLQRLFSSHLRSLALAVLAGALAVMVTALSLGIWTSVPNHWLAGGVVMQLVTSAAVLFFLVRQTAQQWRIKQEDNFSHWMHQIASNNELERLVAMQGLYESVQRQQLAPAKEKALVQCCQILLNHEKEPLVREVVLDTLQTLNLRRISPASTQN